MVLIWKCLPKGLWVEDVLQPLVRLRLNDVVADFRKGLVYK